MLYQCLAEYCGQFYVLKCESSYEFFKLYGCKNSVKQHTFIAYIPLSFEIQNFEFSFPVRIGD